MYEQQFSRTQKLTLTGVLIALTVVVSTLTGITVPIAGVPILRISFAGVFLRLIAILFGPLFAGAAGVITDIVLVIVKPQGSYLWPLTVVAFIKNFSIGYMWYHIIRINFKVYNACYLISFFGLAIFGVVNFAVFRYYPESVYSLFFTGLGSGGSKMNYMSLGLIIIAIAALAIYVVSYILYVKSGNKEAFERYLRLIVSTGVPSIICTTINTVILQKYFLLPDKAFTLVWIPRAAEEIMLVLFNAYLLIIILNIYEKYARK